MERPVDSADSTTYPLAVAVAVVGERSETFIRRQVMDLLPGQTVAIGRLVEPQDRRDWEPAPPLVTPQDPENLTPVVEQLHRYGVEVLLSHYLDESLPWLPAVRETGLRLFVHAHGYDVSERLQDHEYRQRYLEYREAAGIITMSHVSRDRLVDLGLPSAMVHAIPYGVDIPETFPERHESNPVRVIAVGRMVSKKAPLLLLDAVERAARAAPEEFRLDVIGDGPLLGAVRQFVHEHRLEGIVTVHGARPNAEVLALMAASDVFVQHSITDPVTGNQEGLPVAVLEAMAAGLPVVATHHAGIPEAVEDGCTGYLVDERDTRLMANHIVSLTRDPRLRRTMGLAGWDRARNRYGWRRQRSDLLRLMGLEHYAR